MCRSAVRNEGNTKSAKSSLSASKLTIQKLRLLAGIIGRHWRRAVADGVDKLSSKDASCRLACASSGVCATANTSDWEWEREMKMVS